ncbi:MAG: septum formation initiator family protein [Lentisphaeria bacterium]|nr:septum formation initiator family protein [Lentisphaeria bacterium]MBQ7396117.1 septum formation initiator family protein [Lentisphaeria bacterium]MBR7120167.1 septum formation initiator family protein [Lentisphaeria bacterium]
MAFGENKRNRKTPFFTYVGYALLLLMLAVSTVLLFPAYREYKAQQKQLAELKKELAKNKEERDAKLKMYNALERDPKAVEKVAREKYRLLKEGETVLIFRKDEKK